MCTPTHNNIRDLNAAYFFLAQRLLLQDFDAGLFRLGIDRTLASKILDLSVAQIQKLADCRMVLCQLRLSQAEVFAAFCHASESTEHFPMQAATMLADETTRWPATE